MCFSLSGELSEHEPNNVHFCTDKSIPARLIASVSAPKITSITPAGGRVFGCETDPSANPQAVDLAQRSCLNSPDDWAMNSRDKPGPAEEPPKSKPTSLSEARLIIQDYVNELREMIRKLRQRLH